MMLTSEASEYVVCEVAARGIQGYQPVLILVLRLSVVQAIELQERRRILRSSQVRPRKTSRLSPQSSEISAPP